MEEDRKEQDEEMLEDEGESFSQLLEETFVRPARLEAGQRVKGRIVKISGECVFVDLGGKSEGCIDRKELLDEEGKLTVDEGDLVQAYFLSSGDDGLRLTTRITGGEAGRRHLEDAWRSGIPLEGLVEKEIKGGFEIKIVGGLRGFCPYSQMGLQRAADAGELVGRHLAFRITQYDEKGRNIVLSNRAVLEEERQRERDEQKEQLIEGMRVKARIASIHNFGAFIRIGSLEGLIPISEIGWDRVEDISQVLAVGQEVEVVALKLDWDTNRLSFSLRRTIPDPWTTAGSDFPVGSVHRGTVVRLTHFGAFVSLGPGVDGLLHVSKLGAGKRIRHPHEALEAGQVIEVRIESTDAENKRISLSLPTAGQVEQSDEGTEEDLKYLKEKPQSMGTLADLLKAKAPGKKRK
ncbi:MAG: 30S ribosomal protein S1 [Syntrophobacteraceae bacterium]|nr:30S ribosomal protein S1 [Syntrophobacteraceae bacterium]